LQASGRVAEAVASYRAAAERAPAYGVFWDALGAALVSAGRPDEALLEYQRGLTHTSGVEAATIHHAVGRLYAMQGRRQEALLHLQRALDLDPGRRAAREDLARVRIMAGGRLAGSGS
jgi:tetratricopeptide (TPR) repeat protein